MTKRTRRVVLYSTVLFFILATPIILLYSLGYSFDWQNKKLVLTGGLSLESIPKKADVYIDGEIEEKTPISVKRLLPKDYQIRIIKQGFHPWQKKIKIESKLVTEAKNILLIPINPDVEIVKENISKDFSVKEFLSQEKSDNIFYIQKSSYVLYKTNQDGFEQEQISLTPLPAQEYEIFVSDNEEIAVLSENQELYLLDLETKIFEQIGENVEIITFSNDNKKILYATPSEIWVYYLKDINSQPNKKAGEKELITRLGQKIKQVLWYDADEHIIFLVNQNIKITELDGRDERNTVDIIKADAKQITFHKKDKKLYFIEKEKLLRISLSL